MFSERDLLTVNKKGMKLTWDNAKRWQEIANKDKHIEHEPKWDFDCNFKLDFDGSLLSINSRFYPPILHYGEKWDGTLHVKILGETILEKKFECDTLDELQKEVEKFTKHYIGIVKAKLK